MGHTDKSDNSFPISDHVGLVEKRAGGLRYEGPGETGKYIVWMDLMDDKRAFLGVLTREELDRLFPRARHVETVYWDRKLQYQQLANRWLCNGDHPHDAVWRRFEDTGKEPTEPREGQVVRAFRNPEKPGQTRCPECDRLYHDHGWIDSGGAGQTVCPGDYVVGAGSYEVVPHMDFPERFERRSIFGQLVPMVEGSYEEAEHFARQQIATIPNLDPNDLKGGMALARVGLDVVEPPVDPIVGERPPFDAGRFEFLIQCYRSTVRYADAEQTLEIKSRLADELLRNADVVLAALRSRVSADPVENLSTDRNQAVADLATQIAKLKEALGQEDENLRNHEEALSRAVQLEPGVAGTIGESLRASVDKVVALMVEVERLRVIRDKAVAWYRCYNGKPDQDPGTSREFLDSIVELHDAVAELELGAK